VQTWQIPLQHFEFGFESIRYELVIQGPVNNREDEKPNQSVNDENNPVRIE